MLTCGKLFDLPKVLTAHIKVLAYGVGTCESEISVRIESRIKSASTIRIELGGSRLHVQCRLPQELCRHTTLLHATLYVLFFLSAL